MSEPVTRPGPPVALTLVVRRDCWLCDEFAAALARWDDGRGRCRVSERDADDSPELTARYGLRLPVLLAGEQEICAGHLDVVALDRYLATQA